MRPGGFVSGVPDQINYCKQLYVASAGGYTNIRDYTISGQMYVGGAMTGGQGYFISTREVTPITFGYPMGYTGFALQFDPVHQRIMLFDGTREVGSYGEGYWGESYFSQAVSADGFLDFAITVCGDRIWGLRLGNFNVWRLSGPNPTDLADVRLNNVGYGKISIGSFTEPATLAPMARNLKIEVR